MKLMVHEVVASSVNYEDLCRKYKIPQYQNGHAYLTSHRACYVDNEEPRKCSVTIDLKNVERPEFYVRML